MQSAYLNVALIKRLPRSLGVLTYFMKTNEDTDAMVGRWVRVPFRGKMADGVVWSVVQQPPRAVSLQPVTDVLDLPSWDKDRRDFAERFARVHWISLPHALDVMVPERPKREAVSHTTDVSNVRQNGHLRIQQQREREIAVAVGACMQIGGDAQKYFFPLGTRAERIVTMLHICTALPTQQVCILVPTREELLRCASALAGPLGARLLVLDTTLPTGTYWNAWINIARKPGAVVVTTKRGLFAPFRSLGAVVVDMETDRNHRQSDMNPRYDAREIAAWIADQHHTAYCALDAVPTLRTFLDGSVEKKIFSHSPAQRSIIDRLLEPRSGYNDILASQVVDAVKSKQGSVLFFVNRRGTARSVFCGDCGWTATCSSCSLALTVADDRLHCYRCAVEHDLPQQCGRCQNVQLKMRGMGVQWFAGALQKLFPERPIDVLEGAGSSKTLHDGTLIVATEKVFTLPLLPRIGLVVFPDIDVLLRYPGYATYEFVYCLCERVCALGERNTGVFIQTRDPEHPVNRALRERLPKLLYSEEQQTRSILKLPPAVDIFTLTGKGKDRASLERQTKQLIDTLRSDPVIEHAMTREEMGISEARRGKKNVHATLLLRSLSDMPASATLERVRTHLSDAWIVERNPESLTE